MKHFVFGAGLLLCLLPLSMTILFRMEKSRCQSALDAALSDAVYQALETAYTVPCYEVRSREELAADALRSVILRVRSGELTMRIWAADLENGILDLELIIHYDFPLTKGFTVVSRSCGLRDRAASGSTKK